MSNENNSSAPLKTAEGAALGPPEAGRMALTEYLQVCDKHAITPDVGGAFADAFRAGANYAAQAVAAQAPAAVAVPDEREVFENWVRSTYWAPNLEKIDDGYRAPITVALWDSWQARAALAATPEIPATEDSSAGDLAEVQAEPVAWDGKLPESLQRALNEMRVHCKPHIVSGLEFEVRQVFEGMHTSLSTVRRMYWAANARLEAIDEAQPDPFAALQAQPADAPIAYLQEVDQHLLHRFIETIEDDESFDIGKDAVKRLANLGVVESCGFGRYGVTMFGYWVHEHYWHQNPSLPLKTNADRNREHRAAMAAAQEGGNAAKEA